MELSWPLLKIIIKKNYFFLISKIVNGFRSRIEESFPWLIDEMQGIADGSQIPFDTVENKKIYEN